MRLTAALLPIEFACHAKACAPPPVGAGGSKVTAGGLTKQGWTKSGAGDMASYRKGDYVINKSYGAMVGGYSAYHVGGTGDDYKSTVGGKKAKSLTQRDTLEAALRHVSEHESTITFKIITKDQARGDSRPVSHDEFQRLAREGQKQLDGFSDRSSPHTGLDEHWDTIKVNSYHEVGKSWGGATIDSHTGVPLPQGANLFAITVKAGHQTVSVPETASRAEFSAAMDQAKQRFGSILERESHYLGVFHDDENHRIDIDPVLVVRSRADVDTIGAASHSIGGAYNFSDGNGYWPPHVGEG